MGSERREQSRSDADLLRAASKDAAAFRVFYNRYSREILAWLLSHVDDDAAEDLLAETFAQVWLSAPRFRDERDGSARPWLYGIARHILFESFRKRRVEARARKRLGITAHPISFDPSDEIADRLDARARAPALNRALDALSPRQREAVALHVVGGMPPAAVASATASTGANARMRIMRGLTRLRELVEREQDSG